MPPRPAPKLDIGFGEGGVPAGWHLSLLEQAGLLNPGGAEDVVIAVLDTAPHPDRLRSAVLRPEFRRNWLLQRLASDLKRGEGLFDIDYDRRYYVTNDVRTGRNAAGEARYYLMPDHGLFVAGLARDVAPRARIQLIRILNDYGGGDLYNLFAALTDLEHDLASKSIGHLVVNLSLTVMPDIRRLPNVWFEQKRQWQNTQLTGVMRMISYLEEGLRLLFESLHSQGALIVAAAGNDSLLANQQQQRPHPPRTPARYPSTLSVTSVNHRFGPSLFANAACMPPLNSGVATFGGDWSGAKDEHGWPDMVRGVYISSNFPEGEQNSSGWADWCGTSFSTPIISGLGAHLLAQGWSAMQVMTRLTTSQRSRGEKLFGSAPDVPSLLANVIRVQQRFE
ncbi:MAG TPA: S8 family serine peptidase, partial [Ktedonobacteraceae bacterium]|nr:S8 family serine peptidase [Ktedonobacteraceae bacterium]